MTPATAASETTGRGPSSGTSPAGPARHLWREVVDRAGRQCECRGACGRKHKDGGGRCKRLDMPHAPLRAVPREAVATHVAASLPAAGLHALCGPCHDSIAARHAAERAAALRDQASAAALF